MSDQPAQSYAGAFTESRPILQLDIDTAAFSRKGLVMALRDTPAEWFQNAQDKLQQLRSLEDNWDSYGARPVKEESIAMAAAYIATLARVVSISEPAVGASPDGNVTICWDGGKWSLDAEIDARGIIAYVYLDEEDHENDRDSRTRDIGQLAPFLSQWS